ncbi:MAG: hypothetical protein WBH85_06325, partial [Thermoanaerobaculia bacterium]
MANDQDSVKTGWTTGLTRLSITALLFLSVSGLIITFAPFGAWVEWDVIIHTIVGLLAFIPIVWYSLAHWGDYKKYNLSDALLLGYVSALALLFCLVSGLVVTWQGLFGVKMSAVWRGIHLYSTYVALATGLVHVVIVWIRSRSKEEKPAAAPLIWRAVAGTVIGLLMIAGLSLIYSGSQYVNEFPEDYSYVY